MALETQTASTEERRASAGRIPVLGLVLCVALAAFWQIHSLTRGVEHLGGDQHLILTFVLKQEDPSLFPSDLMFDQAERIGNALPLYFGFLRAAFRYTGDPASGYRLLVFPVTFLYLLGAYCVFWRFSRNRWTAVALALFSSLPTYVVLAEEFFGVGPLRLMLARTLITGAFPWLFCAFCGWIDSARRLILLFFALGLLANVYPVTPFYAVGMLIITYLLEMRVTPRAWGVAFALGGAALAGAGFMVWHQVQHMAGQAVASARGGEAAAMQVAKKYLGFVTYPPRNLAAFPRTLIEVLTFGLIAVAALMIVHAWRRGEAPSGKWFSMVAALCLGYLLFPEAKLIWALVAVLLCFPRREGGPREERIAVYFALSVFGVTVTELCLAHLGPLDRPALYNLLARGAQFGVFALFLLLALGLRQIDWSRLRGFPRVALIGLMIAAGVWQVRDTARTYLRTRGDVAAADLKALAQWARAETAPTDRFLFDSAAFRLMARRSLVVASKDHGPIVGNRPERAAAFLERLEAVRRAGTDAHALVAVAARYGADYIVIRRGQFRESGRDSVYANGTYAVLATRSKFQ